jgi:hypothetical protein
VVLAAADKILQTVYNDDEGELKAVAFDETSGKFATCSSSKVYIYKPYGKDERVLKGGTEIELN